MALSIIKNPLETKVIGLCEKVLSGVQLCVVDVDCRVGGRSLVRVFIEHSPSLSTGSTAVTLDDCTKATRLLGDEEEMNQWFPGPFDLEVSSPGIERRLRTEDDFNRFTGHGVKVKLVEKWPGHGANLTGTIEGVLAGVVQLRVNLEELKIPLSKITRATLVYRAVAE